MMFLRRHGRRYDLPLDRDGAQRLLPWIVALMTYIAAMTLLAALVLGSLAWRWTDDVSGAVTVLLPPSTDQAVGSNEGRILGVRDALAGTKGHTEVRTRLPSPPPRRRVCRGCFQPRLSPHAATRVLGGPAHLARVPDLPRRRHPQLRLH